MTWVAYNTSVGFEASALGAAHWFVYQRKVNDTIVTPEAADDPVFGPFPAPQAARLALLLNDFMLRSQAPGADPQRKDGTP